jgi:hypothetical protein
MVVDDEIDKIKEYLLKTDGIVGVNVEEFRFFLDNCMSRKMLDQIGGELNSFSKKSFRLEQLTKSRFISFDEAEE